MIAVYTYKTPQYSIYSYETNQIYWHNKSVESAKKLGYETLLYTNDRKFSSKCDSIIYVEDSNLLWDSLKIQVLSNPPSSDYFLLDNDIILDNLIPFTNRDIYFDGLESSINTIYRKTLHQIDKFKVFDNIEFWNTTDIKPFNCGILKINSQSLLEDYIYWWNKMYKLIQPYLYKLDLTVVTPVISQIVLTLLANTGSYSYEYFTNDWNRQSNGYYTHFISSRKVLKTNLI